jgi:ribonuclease HII
MFAGAAILPEGETIPGATDSKKLSPAERERLAEVIKRRAIEYSVKAVSAETIDSMGLSKATALVMYQTLCGLNRFQWDALAILIDGRPLDISWHSGNPCKFIAHGDSESHSIAAASIIAKVGRDAYMAKQHGQYPE